MRQYSGEVFINTKLPTDPTSYVFGITRDHCRLNTHILECCDSFPGFFPNNIGEGNCAQEDLISNSKDDGLPFFAGILNLSRKFTWNSDVDTFKECRSADHHFFIFNKRPYSPAFQRFKLFWLFKRNFLLFGLRHDSFGDRML